MRIKPTNTGRSITGDTPNGIFAFTVLDAADGKDFNLILADGTIVGKGSITFKQPPISPAAESDSQAPCCDGSGL